MTKFTTRVELYGSPDYATYEKLHSAMEVTYWMPHAEYNLYAEKTAETVKDLAVKAAGTVWRDFAVLVTKTETDRAIYNLKKV